MRVTMTGATGRVGGRIAAALKARGDEVTVLSRNPERARAALGVDAVAWRPEDQPAPAEALAGRDGVIHLAGEDIAQRWTDEVKRRVMRSRELGTRNLVAGLRAADPRPRGADLRVRGRLVRPRPRRRPADRAGAGRRGLPRRRLRRVGARGGRRRDARRARRPDPHRDRARQGRRGAREDAPAVQARGRRPGRRRAPVPALDPPRRPGRAVPRRARPRLVAGRSTAARPSRSRTATSAMRSAARCTVPRWRPSPASRSGCSTARWPTWWSSASARCRRDRSSWASDSPIRTSTRRSGAPSAPESTGILVYLQEPLHGPLNTG